MRVPDVAQCQESQCWTVNGVRMGRLASGGFAPPVAGMRRETGDVQYRKSQMSGTPVQSCWPVAPPGDVEPNIPAS